MRSPLFAEASARDKRSSACPASSRITPRAASAASDCVSQIEWESLSDSTSYQLQHYLDYLRQSQGASHFLVWLQYASTALDLGGMNNIVVLVPYVRSVKDV
ncbi:hypothetical protein CC2G_011795 [Coprinopsis cinerea AmutBmut pab1-1]|nr:hypothetical protein CC2G_011795 [Coprinopsis cinerea AmutBmut pab1-1]